MVRQTLFLTRVALAGFISAGLMVVPTIAAQASQSSTQPDNTRANEPDRAAGGVTADQQKENRSDRDLTQQIRKAVIADKSLSTYAHNVKIIAQSGQVTLKGPVRSDEEKKTVVAKAQEIAGSGKVDDQLTVKPGKEKSK